MPRFTTHFALAPAVDGEVEIEVFLVPPVDPAIVNELEVLLGHFFNACARGAFVLEDLDPTKAVFLVNARRVLGSGLSFICHVAGIDPRCFTGVLRNDLVMFTELNHPVRSLNVRMKGARGSVPPSLGTSSIDNVYPPVSKHLSFRYEIAPSDDPKSSRYVEISLAQPLSDDASSTIVEWIEDWAEMAMGGFALSEKDLESGECAIFDAIPDLRDEATIEVPISMFGAPDVAWNTLLNLCGRIDLEIASVKFVSIR